MYNRRVQRRQSRKRSCRRNRAMYGGGAGLSYSFAGSVDPNNPGLGNAARVVPVSSCGDAAAPGRISDTGTAGGVPGFGGRQYGGSNSGIVDPIDSLMKMAGQTGGGPGSGGRQYGGSNSGVVDPVDSLMKMAGQTGGGRQYGGSSSGVADPIDSLMKMAGQTGGGYSMNPVGGPAPFMDRTYSGCGEGAFATRNPLNEAVPSTITAPPALKGGRRRRSRKCWSGGRRSLSRRRSMRGGMAPVDGMVYEAPPSGYTFAPSNSSGGSAGTLADGKAPFAVAVPYTAQPSASSACLKTGGRRRRNSRKHRR